MCCFTNGNYFYKTLMTLYRKNNQSRYAWYQLVLGAQKELVNYGNGYDLKMQLRNCGIGSALSMSNPSCVDTISVYTNRCTRTPKRY